MGDDGEADERTNGQVLEVVTLSLAHLAGHIGDAEYEDGIRIVSAEVRGSPANLVAYLGRFGAVHLSELAHARGEDPERFLQQVVAPTLLGQQPPKSV